MKRDKAGWEEGAGRPTFRREAVPGPERGPPEDEAVASLAS